MRRDATRERHVPAPREAGRGCRANARRVRDWRASFTLPLTRLSASFSLSRSRCRDALFASEVCEERTLREQGRAERRGPGGPAGLIASRRSGGTMLFDEASSETPQVRHFSGVPRAVLEALFGTAPGGLTFRLRSRGA